MVWASGVSSLALSSTGGSTNAVTTAVVPSRTSSVSSSSGAWARRSHGRAKASIAINGQG